MKIAMVAAEAAPYIKTGGLGDVMEALPQALSDYKNMEVCVFLPFYKKIKQNAKIDVEEVGSLTMQLGWRDTYVGIYQVKSKRRKLRVYLIDNEYYFGRDTVYGAMDDGERFAFFSQASLEAMDYLDFRPEILHCHDWQASLAPLLYHAKYEDKFPGMKTVLTIHNLEYQGWANPDFLGNVLGLDESYRDVVTCGTGVNFLKTAIATADAVTTVSRTYAQEIQTPWFGQNLCGILQQEKDKVHGIVNGISMERFNPETDKDLTVNFNAETYPEKKALAKDALREELGLDRDSKAPILSIVSRLAGHKGIDLLCYIAETLMQERDVQLVVCGSGEFQYERALSDLAARYPGKCAAYIGFHPSLANRIYGGTDIYLMPSRSEPCGLSQLISMRYGGIPVVNSVGGLKDTIIPYNAETGEGRGFTFQSYNGEDFLDAVDRACALYNDAPDAWTALVQRNMCLDLSWKVSGQEYMNLYKDLLK